MSVHFVVFHRPGPRWQPGVAFREQDGISEHVAHYRKLHADGKLELGGPYLDDSGGMMIAAEAVTHEEIVAFAKSDPAVRSGLLEFEVRPWYAGMRKDPS